MKEAPVIGQLWSPAWSVSTTPMPGTDFQSAPAAAALKVTSSGSTNLPALFWTWPWESLFCLA